MSEPATERRSGPSLPAPPPAAIAVCGLTALLLLLALAGAGGSALIACSAASAAALAAIGVWSRSVTALVVAGALAAAAVLGAVGLSLGGRASTAGSAGHPFPLVVGLPLQRAEALFQRHGPVNFVIKRVAYGARDTVLHATGYSPDGTYAPGSTITLVVGTRAPSTPAPR
ncbi:MAG TPA: hypothetical protein VFJ66_07990 [Gaiellales bacterium]|nr:hypothetical protein [Gaiellales bacterium]